MMSINPAKIASGLAALGVLSTASVSVVQHTGKTTSSTVQLADVPRQYAAPNAAQHSIVSYAFKYGPQSRTVYVWGGTSPRGFDCSGFSQFVYLHSIGVLIPRTTESQWFASSGVRVARQSERAGDLVYFAGAYGNLYSPGHMGVYIGGGRYIEYYHSGAPSRISYLSEFTRGYLGAKRWYTPARVPVRILGYLDRLAARNHVLIINSFTRNGWRRWAVDFVPRSRSLYSWARRNHIRAVQLPHRTRLLFRP